MQLYENIKLIQGELWERLESTQIVARHNVLTPVKGKATTLIGMRRVGKTFAMLDYLMKLAKQEVPQEAILFLNLEDDRLQLEKAADLTRIVDLFYSTTPANHRRRTFVFLDEIQVLAGWERVARRLVETDKCELWLSGSSAKMLSKDVATQFRGRSISHEIWPYDFFEYLTASNIEWIDPSVSFASHDLAREQLELFLLQGGFPELVHKGVQVQRRILSDYRDVVILRDIVERHRVANHYALEQLVSAAIANSGRLLSINKLTADFRSRGIAVGKDTLFEYLSYIEDAYLAFTVPLYSESLRVRSTTPKKVYCIDTGMVSSYAVRPKADLGRLFENLVFVDLKRHGFKVFYYVTKEGAKVDFVAVNQNGQPFVLQVCFDADDEKTMAREQQSLKAACKELGCEGMLLSPAVYCQGKKWLPGL